MGLRKYDKSYRSNLFVAMAITYGTMFENNIWTHGWGREKMFLRNKNDTETPQDIYRTLMYLFSTKDDQHNVPDSVFSEDAKQSTN